MTDPDDRRAQADHERKAGREQPTPHIAQIDTRVTTHHGDTVHEWRWACVICGQHGAWALTPKVAAREAETHIHQRLKETRR